MTAAGPSVLVSSIRERLWHNMRLDLSQFVPDVAGNRLLMCCCYGRWLPQEDFDLEHLIPQQAVKLDPVAVRTNPATPVNVRAGNLLLCKKPLQIKGQRLTGTGCNGWKGRVYDSAIRSLVTGESLRKQGTITQLHIIGALCLGYLAMVAQFGYRVVLIRSGLMMRQQFFSPLKFHRDMPIMSQMLLGGSLPIDQADAPMWHRPFSFRLEPGRCVVVSRNFCVPVPVSDDFVLPVMRYLPFVPTKHLLRPNFTTFFD